VRGEGDARPGLYISSASTFLVAILGMVSAIEEGYTLYIYVEPEEIPGSIYYTPS
jgi:hypothetical protein